MPKAKAKKSRARTRPSVRRFTTVLRRTAIGLVTAGALSTPLSSCGLWPRMPSLDALPSMASLTSLTSLLPALPASFSLPSSLPSLASLRSLLPSFSWPALLPDVVRPQSGAGSGRFAECPQHFPGGIAPAIAKEPLQRELCYDAFAVLHYGQTRTPLFVAERLNHQSVEAAKGEQRTNKFFADARLPRSERAELSDYKGSGYARGHMAPAGDMPNTTAMAQSFSLANMVPQDQRQNSGPWSKIEQDTRRYASRAQGDVFVITGPVFGPDSATVGANHVRVPTHLFKLVYDATTKKAWAHWQANAPDARVSPPISYRELEQRTGLSLLPGIRVK